jgi:hypothetical protein
MPLNTISILIVALSGLAVIYYAVIRRKRKEQKEPPYNPQKEEPITHINKKLFLEVPIEKIAIIYFILIILIYLAKLIPGIIIPAFSLMVLYLSGLMFLLLIYKMVMVITLVKKFSPWIFFSIIFSGLIFTMAIAGLRFYLTELLISTRQYHLTIHLLGLSLGLGGTFTADIIFTHFLRKYKITKEDSVLMHLISQMIILGLFFLLLSGLALLLPFAERLLEMAAFLMKMLAVAIIILNGVVLNLYVTPKMKQISLLEQEKERHKTLMKISFALGAVSIVSWLSAFLLIMLKELNEFSLPTLAIAYLLLLLTGIAGSQYALAHYEEREFNKN